MERNFKNIDDRLQLWKRYNFIDKNWIEKKRTLWITNWITPVMLLMYNSRSIGSSYILKKDDIISFDWVNVICNTYLF